MSSSPIIGIDCRLAGVDHAGIGRYIEELVRHVISDQSLRWVLFFHHGNQLSWLQPTSNVKVVLAPIRHYTLTEQLFMPGIFAQQKLDLLHVPHFNIPLVYTGNLVVTIHDLLWHEQKGAHVTTLSPTIYAVKHIAYTFVAGQAISRSKKIFVPTHTVKASIMQQYPTVNAEKIHVTYEGVGDVFHYADQSKNTRDKILFYTGSLYPHKNLLLVVHALKKLPDYELHISSSRTVFSDEFLKEVHRLGLQSRVKHLGRLSDEQLLSCYQRSFALVQPSLSEGFGLTGVEALAAGLPVLASDIPVFHEIYKEAFIPFDPQNVKSFVSAVHLLENSNRQDGISKGRAVAREYSWKKMAHETVKHYKDVLSNV